MTKKKVHRKAVDEQDLLLCDNEYGSMNYVLWECPEYSSLN